MIVIIRTQDFRYLSKKNGNIIILNWEVDILKTITPTKIIRKTYTM